MLLLSGKIDKKGKFGNQVDPEVVLSNARFLRNFAETRAASANVVRIRGHKDDLKVQQAAAELIEWLDAVMAAYTPLAGGKPCPRRLSPPR